jgi:hypothetical protein
VPTKSSKDNKPPIRGSFSLNIPILPLLDSGF